MLTTFGGQPDGKRRGVIFLEAQKEGYANGSCLDQW
jgi:hypothetical protein